MPNPRPSPLEVIAMHGENWPEVDTPGHALTVMIAAVRGRVVSHVFPVCERYGLTPAEFDVLAALRRSAPPYEQTPTEILRRTVVTSGGLTKILYRLEEKGWIERVADPEDRRSNRARLTPAGRRQQERAMAALLDELGWMEEALSASEAAQLVRLLGKLWQAGGAAARSDR
jgi:DNA-binding MarR family transcriptional regulator